MILFDSHAHFPADTAAGHAAQIARARDAGLCGLLAVGGSEDIDAGALTLAKQYPGFVHLALGYDRDTATTVAGSPAALSAAMSRLRERITRLSDDGSPLCAIGEIGLDFSRNPDPAEKSAQTALFGAQLLLAAELDLPCSIHSRDADDETLRILSRSASKARLAETRMGVIHCFTGGTDFASALVALGLHIGISGIITFRNAAPLRGTVSTLPRDRLIVETDCPCLTPVPMRGKPNEPALIVHTAARLAEVLGIPAEEAALITTSNAMRLFGILK
jgi:TatD DNase family protein